jgi:hypothetical protein
MTETAIQEQFIRRCRHCRHLARMAEVARIEGCAKLIDYWTSKLNAERARATADVRRWNKLCAEAAYNRIEGY